MKKSSLILNIFKGLQDLQAKHDDDFAGLEKDFKSFVLKAVAVSYDGSVLSKQHDLYQANDEIEEVLSNLMRNAENASEVYANFEIYEKAVSKLRGLLEEVATETEFYSLEKSMRSKIFNTLDTLTDALEIMVEHKEYSDMSDLQSDLFSIYESFEYQKERGFEDTGSHNTLNDLREILEKINQ
jgi:hypothetical protein